MKLFGRNFKNALICVLLASFVSGQAYAQMRDPLGVLKDQNFSSGVSEYVFKNDLDEVLVPVFVMGAVTKPGLYHVPARTDLITLLSLTGGPTKDADLEDITIKRPQTNQVSDVDVDRVLTEKDLRSPTLGSNDVVYVKAKEPWISQNAVVAVTLISSMVGIIVSGLVITKSSK